MTTAELEHRYGPNVHLVDDPVARTLLARLSRRDVAQPEVGRLLTELYRSLAWSAIARELPREELEIETRMIAKTRHGVWRGEGLVPSARAVVVAIARAGLVPSQEVYELLLSLLDPSGVRQDHLAVGRAVDEDGHVTGAHIGSVKIGGDVDGAYLFLPDPMGATGSTLNRVLKLYREEFGRPAKVLALNLIVTPEYLRAVASSSPEAIVWAYRIDRGLSADDVLATVPGERWDEERGLDPNDYIVPGAGGLGEVITNSWV